MNRNEGQHEDGSNPPLDQSRDDEKQRADRFPTFGNYCANVVEGFATIVLLVLIGYPALLTLLEWARPFLMEWGFQDFARTIKQRLRLKGRPMMIEYSLYISAAFVVAYPLLAAINYAWRKISMLFEREDAPKRKSRIT